jgi:hypothetical protein
MSEWTDEELRDFVVRKRALRTSTPAFKAALQEEGVAEIETPKKGKKDNAIENFLNSLE